MTYGFYMLDLPDDLLVLRDAAEVDSAYDCDRDALDLFLDRADPYSFGLNAAGMGFCRERMDHLGMLAGGESGPWPPYPTWDPLLYRDGREVRHANPDVWREWAQANRRPLAQRGVGEGIPRFKLSSNDGWIVVAEEIEGALRAYDEQPARVREELEADEIWAAWVAWLRRTRLGFEVW